MHPGAKELWMKTGDHSDSRTSKRKKKRFPNPGEIFAHQKFLKRSSDTFANPGGMFTVIWFYRIYFHM